MSRFGKGLEALRLKIVVQPNAETPERHLVEAGCHPDSGMRCIDNGMADDEKLPLAYPTVAR